jgi:hypothetical protein
VLHGVDNMAMGKMSPSIQKRQPARSPAKAQVAPRKPAGRNCHGIGLGQGALKRQFDELADRWERETLNLSNPNAAERHPAYSAIVDLGKPAIPLVLNRLARSPAFWFSALLRMSGEKNNPVNPSMLGDLQAMADAWIAWGEKHGYGTME